MGHREKIDFDTYCEVMEIDIKYLEKENAELKVKLDEVNELLRKCKDTVQASLAEEGISDMRRSYREDLYKLIENELKEQGE